uniref:ubiquitinyl hydrolase 1 n=1 Tax=Zonotrichia albicollis TaxID=44394 RepID=A0A8D2MPY6_ZONAL
MTLRALEGWGRSHNSLGSFCQTNLLSKFRISAFFTFIILYKYELASTPPRKSARLLSHVHGESLIPRKFREVATASPTSRQRLKQFYSIRRQPLMTPGVTGLRNLGNTCYMNSILQVLSHLQKFRECFLTLDLCETEELLAKTVNGRARMPGRLANGAAASEPGKPDKVQSSPGSMNGGSSISRSLELIQPKEPSSKHISLCHELHTLFRVMWSGKWALVSPFAMLHSVWSLIPAFRGYDQQDAQEFLCELLDKVQQELESEGSRRRILIPFSQRKLTKQVLKVVNTIFHGQLLSQVTCRTCNYKSNTVEPFWDLSLEFPERYHALARGLNYKCLLGNYEWLLRNSKWRKSSPKPLVLSEAKKQLLIYRLPQVLRLHLKRFRDGIGAGIRDGNGAGMGLGQGWDQSRNQGWDGAGMGSGIRAGMGSGIRVGMGLGQEWDQGLGSGQESGMGWGRNGIRDGIRAGMGSGIRVGMGWGRSGIRNGIRAGMGWGRSGTKDGIRAGIRDGMGSGQEWDQGSE